jgi:ankyrin repeat protein
MVTSYSFALIGRYDAPGHTMRFASSFFLGLFFGISVTWAGALHDAAKSGDIESAKQAVAAHANIGELNAAGEPALIIAALSGHRDVVLLLLENGGDINIRNKGGLTALHAAAYGGHLEIAETLVAKGAQVNDDKNFYHMSPLHAAAEEGHADVVAFLLASKADIEAKERNGYTPLTQAGWRSHWDAAEVMLKAGAVCQEAAIVGDWLYSECTKRK